MPSDDERTPPRPLSRRTFLRTAAIGTATAAIATTLEAAPALADDTTTGQITLSAIPVTYASAPLGLQGTIVWQATKHRTNTWSMTSAENRSVGISFDSSISGGGITIGSGESMKQTTSTSTTNAATTRETAVHQLVARADPQFEPDGYATVLDTGFLLLVRPKVEMVGNLNGFKFKFLDGGILKIVSIRALTDPNDAFGARAELGQQTVDAILGIYPLTKNPGDAQGQSGELLGLGKPRFKKKGGIEAGQGSNPFTFQRSITSSSSVSVTGSHTVSTTITDSQGFEGGIPGIITIKSMFSTSKTIEVTTTGVQEQTNETVVTAGPTDIWNNRRGIRNNLYWDRVYKCFLITNEGEPKPTDTTVQGQARDASGNPIAGAYVSLGDGSSTFSTRADSGGSYALHTPASLAAGSYPVYCGDGSTFVSLGGGGTVTANVAVPTPASAGQEPSPYPSIE